MKHFHKDHVVLIDFSNEGICDCGDCDVDNTHHCPVHSNLQSKSDKNPKAFYDSVWLGSHEDFSFLLRTAYDLLKWLFGEYQNVNVFASIASNSQVNETLAKVMQNKYFVRIVSMVLYFCNVNRAPEQSQIDELF